ncbi:bile acid:sodium symporter family protein [Telluribacter sp. SYSU D00476]|uniref:bile acid:sodium symporter family protein n=1 Tax=Telluribacter sp. SYSU D00476 TaxID=2811430 RepID=UPI001FF53344|nr:bile acid:sodium symporter family protein [Telluribacter sp. SYSU D00476]
MKDTDSNRWQRISNLAKRAGLDDFLLALIGVVILAYLWPYPGTDASPVPLAEIANYGVSLIFFFYGLRLSPQKLRAGLSNWRLHIVVHVSTFILFPLLALGVRPFFVGEENHTLWLAIFFLAALPSTVSSSVVMVSMAGGNIPGAIFNASISSLLGVFITPIWMGLVLEAGPGEFELTEVMIKLVLQVLLPVVLGVLLYGRYGAFAERNKATLRYIDQFIILLIVYTSFCESFENRLFSQFDAATMLWLTLGIIMLFFLVYYLLMVLCRLIGFNREDQITAVFCGTKKSLVQGAVMSKVLFAGAASAGIILLPIMIYHAFQLLVVSIIAQRLARQNEAGA